MPDLKCYKCDGPLTTRDVQPAKFYCAACDLELDARTAHNPEHAKAMHEAAEGLMQAKECPHERLEAIAVNLLDAAAAGRAAKKLFPALFDMPSPMGEMDPFAIGQQAGELLQHCLWLTEELNHAHGEARIWLMRVRDCALGDSASEQNFRRREIAVEGLKAMGLDREPAETPKAST